MKRKQLLLFCSLLFIGAISFAQGRVITGTVRNAQGFVFPGVDVIVKGSTGGTTTGENGKYSIYTNAGNAILVFTYPGCEIKQVTVGTETVKDVVLNCEIEPLRKKDPLLRLIKNSLPLNLLRNEHQEAFTISPFSAGDHIL